MNNFFPQQILSLLSLQTVRVQIPLWEAEVPHVLLGALNHLEHMRTAMVLVQSLVTLAQTHTPRASLAQPFLPPLALPYLGILDVEKEEEFYLQTVSFTVENT